MESLIPKYNAELNDSLEAMPNHSLDEFVDLVLITAQKYLKRARLSADKIVFSQDIGNYSYVVAIRTPIREYLGHIPLWERNNKKRRPANALRT